MRLGPRQPGLLRPPYSMKQRSGVARHRGALLLVATCFALNIPSPSHGEWVDPETRACPYGTFYVKPETGSHNTRGMIELESGRLEVSRLVSQEWVKKGMVRAQSDSEASWALVVNAGLNLSGKAEYFLSVGALSSMVHHLMVLQLDDPTFGVDLPSRSFGAPIVCPLRPAQVGFCPGLVRNFAQMNYENFIAPTVTALCAKREQLIEEGWSEVEELRQSLIEEMARARQQQREKLRRKELRIESVR